MRPKNETGFSIESMDQFIIFTGSAGKESACNVGDLGSIPRSGRSPGEGNGNSLQYLCQENPTDREAWRATVHRVTESDTTEQLTLSLFHDKLKPIRC